MSAAATVENCSFTDKTQPVRDRRLGLFIVVAMTFAAGTAAGQALSQMQTNRLCLGGFAGSFTCSGVDLLAYMPKAELGAEEGSLADLWGWTDPQTGREYALVGLSTGTAFVDISDPFAPEYVAFLPSQSFASSWRDIKVYANHAFIVAEASGHGVQVIDLTQLRGLTSRPATLSATAVYRGIGSAHNIAVNEETGFAYALAARGGDFLCGPGLHMIDVRTPTQPVLAGCFAHAGTGRLGTGYTHDAQCVLYRGPDSDYDGREICVGSNETHISVADVTDKTAPKIVSSATYPTAQYIHQGWLTDDHHYFIQNDELDELRGIVSRTTTYVWDLSDLDAPLLTTTYTGSTTATDHNLYVVNHWAYMANYRAGLQVVDFTDVRNPREVAFFDTFPSDNSPSTSGAWGVYPFFESGSVIVSGIGEGLFILKPPFRDVATGVGEIPESGFSIDVFPNPVFDEATLAVTVRDSGRVEVTLSDLLGREVQRYDSIFDVPGITRRFHLDTRGLAAGRYILRVLGPRSQESQLVTVAR